MRDETPMVDIDVKNYAFFVLGAKNLCQKSMVFGIFPKTIGFSSNKTGSIIKFLS